MVVAVQGDTRMGVFYDSTSHIDYSRFLLDSHDLLRMYGGRMYVLYVANDFDVSFVFGTSCAVSVCRVRLLISLL